jgi:hypothetical protein
MLVSGVAMDYFVFQVAGLQGASQPLHGVGSAEVVRVWESAESLYDYLVVRGDSLDDALALGRSSGFDVLSYGRIEFEGVDESADAPALEDRLPTYLMSGADLFDSKLQASGPQASVGPPHIYCDDCQTFHRKGQHTQ